MIIENLKSKNKIIRMKCDTCGKEYNRSTEVYKKRLKNKYCDKDYCEGCWRKKISKTPEFIERLKKSFNTVESKKRRSDGQKKRYEDPEVRKRMSEKLKSIYKNTDMRKKISNAVKLAYRNDLTIKKRANETFKKSGANIGEKNGMKQLEARKKVSEARKMMFKDPEIRKLYAEKTKNAWKNGKFDGVNVGQCKWFEYKHSDGQSYKVQGTWELAFIKWLDENKLEFLCHKKWIPYDLNGEIKNWYPDFWVKEWNSYVDVKCEHFYIKEKFDAIEKSNPDIKVLVLFKPDLIKLGVKI
jgi:hypothetical protein